MKGKGWLVLMSAVSMLLIAGCSVEGVETGAAVSAAGGGQSTKWENEFNRGKENLASGYFGLALEHFKSALALKPNSARVMNAVAVTYDRLNRYDLAQLYYDRALAIEPNSATTLNNVGYSMLTRGRYEESLVYFMQALKQQQDAEDKRVVSANRQLALDRLREARQQDGGEKIVNSSFTTDARDDQVDCRGHTSNMVARSGARVFTLITNSADVGSMPTDGSAEGDQAYATGKIFGRDCDSDARPRVAMITTFANARDDARHDVVGPRSGVAAKPASVATVLQSSVGRNDQQTQVAPKPERGAVRSVGADGPKVELSNGAGRNKLGARMRRYLESKGLNINYLTNAASFDNRRTTIFYKAGNRSAAEAFAKQLPITVEFVEIENHFADIRIRLGADILEFDRNKLYAGTIGEPNV
jgi:Tfp pilus assembly protein PilF